MNEQTEALKMAIKLMEEENLDLTDAYQACKEALEQSAQEPNRKFKKKENALRQN